MKWELLTILTINSRDIFVNGCNKFVTNDLKM